MSKAATNTITLNLSSSSSEDSISPNSQSIDQKDVKQSRQDKGIQPSAQDFKVDFSVGGQRDSKYVQLKAEESLIGQDEEKDRENHIE